MRGLFAVVVLAGCGNKLTGRWDGECETSAGGQSTVWDLEVEMEEAKGTLTGEAEMSAGYSYSGARAARGSGRALGRGADPARARRAARAGGPRRALAARPAGARPDRALDRLRRARAPAAADDPLVAAVAAVAPAPSSTVDPELGPMLEALGHQQAESAPDGTRALAQ